MLLSPLGERLGEGVLQETAFAFHPSPNLSPKGERNMKGVGSSNDYHQASEVTAIVICGWCDMISVGPGQEGASASNLHSAGDRLGD
jgi:hypothetical protein